MSHETQQSPRPRVGGRAQEEPFIAAIMAVLEHHEAAKGLSWRAKQAIACEAIAGGHLQDEDWLATRIKQGVEAALDAESDVEEADHEEGWDDDYRADSSREVGAAVAEPEATKKALPPIYIATPLVISSQQELDTAIANHRLWMESVLDPQMEVGAGRANFRGSDLSGLNMKGVNLSCADFTGANLTGAQLCFANLSRARFMQANMQGADLRGAKLRKAGLAGADLRQANLEEADLTAADLSGAQLAEAKLPAGLQDKD